MAKKSFIEYLIEPDGDEVPLAAALLEATGLPDYFVEQKEQVDAAVATAVQAETQFKASWLGEQSADPTQDLNGDPLTGGEVYTNSLTGKTRIYNTVSGWQDPAAFSGTPSVNSIDPSMIGGDGSSLFRLKNYLMVGQQADMDGFGKGGILIGGGWSSRGMGAFISNDGHGNWLTVQTAKNENPTELIVYSASGQGYAETVVGTNQIERKDGTEFQARWEGNVIYFLRKKFRVLEVINADLMAIEELGGGSVTFPDTEIEAFNYLYTTGAGAANVVGDRVYWVSGDPFVPAFFRDFKFTLGGVVRTIAEFLGPTEVRLSAALATAFNVEFSYQGDINDQITTLRVQAIQGPQEENVNLYSIAGSEFYGRYYALRAGAAGEFGKSRPIYIGSGDYGPYQSRDHIGIYPPDDIVGHHGYLALGGVQGLEALRVYLPETMSTARNWMRIDPWGAGFAPGIQSAGLDANVDLFLAGQGSGAILLGSQNANWLRAYGSPSGFGVGMRAQGAVDANVNIGIDVKGIGEVLFTSDFARTMAKIRAPINAVNFLTLDASATVPALSVDGADADIDLLLGTKGTGLVRFGTVTATSDVPIVAYITVKDAAGGTRKLAVVA